MKYDKKSILEHWDDENVESMQDKYVVESEIALIAQHIGPNAKILDAGCGEGEGTSVYAKKEGAVVHAVDFSETRLKKAKERLKDYENIQYQQVDFLEDYKLDNDYDLIISQRMLINLGEWELQSKVLKDFINMLKTGGKLLTLEGNQEGVDELNQFREAYGLKPIPVRWHNRFLKNEEYISFMKENGMKLVDEGGLGAYFFLTRGVRGIYEENPTWQSDFNKIANQKEMADLLGFGHKFSRVKLWVFQK